MDFQSLPRPMLMFGIEFQSVTRQGVILGKKVVILVKKVVISENEFQSDRCKVSRFRNRAPTDRCKVSRFRNRGPTERCTNRLDYLLHTEGTRNSPYRRAVLGASNEHGWK